MNLFIDIETTGLVPKGAHWEVDYEMFPHVLSLAWKRSDKKIGRDFLIHQEGRRVPKEATAINGITTKMANGDGAEPASFVFNALMCDAKDSFNVIGHNLYFDISIIKAGILRTHGPKSKEAKQICEVMDKDKRIDTMREAQRFFGKWPKLTELYYYLFKESFDAHTASADVAATERCYNEMVKRKLI